MASKHMKTYEHSAALKMQFLLETTVAMLLIRLIPLVLPAYRKKWQKTKHLSML